MNLSINKKPLTYVAILVLSMVVAVALFGRGQRGRSTTTPGVFGEELVDGEARMPSYYQREGEHDTVSRIEATDPRPDTERPSNSACLQVTLDGVPLDEAVIRLYVDGCMIEAKPLKEQGLYSADTAGKNGAALIVCEGDGFATHSARRFVGPGVTTAVDIVSGMAITGYVVGANGQPIAGVLVVATDDDIMDRDDLLLAADMARHEARQVQSGQTTFRKGASVSGRDGAFTISGLTAGEWVVTLEDKTQRSIPVRVEAGVRDVVIRAEPVACVELDLRGADGSVVQEFVAELLGRDPTSGKAKRIAARSVAGEWWVTLDWPTDWGAVLEVSATAMVKGMAPATTRTVRVRRGEIVNLQAELGPWPVVRTVDLVFANGVPCEADEVTVWTTKPPSLKGASGTAKRLVGGGYRIGVPEGAEEVVLKPDTVPMAAMGAKVDITEGRLRAVMPFAGTMEIWSNEVGESVGLAHQYGSTIMKKNNRVLRLQGLPEGRWEVTLGSRSQIVELGEAAHVQVHF
jgi:hypothetical protein